LGDGSLCLVLHGVVFSESETGRGGQAVVSPVQKGVFGVKSFYNVIGCHDGVHFSWKIVWRNYVLLRVAFFVWSAALEKILTMDSL